MENKEAKISYVIKIGIDEDKKKEIFEKVGPCKSYEEFQKKSKELGFKDYEPVVITECKVDENGNEFDEEPYHFISESDIRSIDMTDVLDKLVQYTVENKIDVKSDFTNNSTAENE